MQLLISIGLLAEILLMNMVLLQWLINMFIIKCPYCGNRDHSEFSYGGEAHIVRPKQPTELSDNQWAEYLFMRKNIKGLQYERWNHAHGCRRWFNMARDTSNDKIHSVYKMGDKPAK